MTTFQLPIGDWSHDGHGKSNNFTIESNFPLARVNKAYKKALKDHPELNPEEFACDYEDSRVPESVVEAMKAVGLDPNEIFEPAYNNDDEYTADPHTMAAFVIEFIKLGDENLTLKLVKEPDSLEFSGQIGYGCYYG